MIFVKNRFFGFALYAMFHLAACTGNNNATIATQSPKQLQPVQSAGADLVGSDSGIMVVEFSREKMFLLGLWQQMPLSGIREAIKNNAQLIVNRIVNDRYKMEGGLTVYYKTFPKEGTVDVFIGIPVKPGKVKMPPLNNGFELLPIDKGIYMKATVNAEPGNTLNSWNAFKNLMIKKGVCPVDYFNSPNGIGYFECYQDSRNAEMTTTVGQAILSIKKP